MCPLWKHLCDTSELLHTCRVSILVKAMRRGHHKTTASVHVLRAPQGAYRFAGMGSISGWSSPFGSCTASPPGLCFSFLAFPQFPSLTGSSVLCPGNQLPHTNTQQGNSFPCSSLVSSCTKSQKGKKNLTGQPELDLFPFRVLVTHFQPPGTASQSHKLSPKPTNFHPNPHTSTSQALSTPNQVHGSHPSRGPSKADTAQVRQLKVTEFGGSGPYSQEYREAPAATGIPV